MTHSLVLRAQGDRVRNSFELRSPAVRVESGGRLVVETLDARWGAMAGHEPGSLIDLEARPAGQGNALTGPIGVVGAKPGGAVAVDVERIVCSAIAWTGAHARPYPAGEGRVPHSRARICSIERGEITFNDQVRLPLSPMVGTIGTTMRSSSPRTEVGRFGGNLDHPLVGEGARVYLPVFIPEAGIYVGDVHARQGDGELSAIGMEVGAEVTLSLTTRNDLALDWPWVETNDVLAVLTCGRTFGVARRRAVVAMMGFLEHQLDLEPAEALALISVAGDVRVGQAIGGRDLTLRLELSRAVGVGLERSPR